MSETEMREGVERALKYWVELRPGLDNFELSKLVCLLASQAEPLARAVNELLASNERLRAAITAAGFAVMQTSGAWSIHDVSERGKAEEAKSLEVATRNVDLEIENDRLRAALKPFATIAAVEGITTDDSVQLLAYEYAPETATVGDCRRAAELLKGATA